MEDVTSLVQAVEGYEENDNPWSDDLERFISHVARTGDILAPWEKVQKVFKNKLRLVMDEFYSTNPYKVGKVNANATNDDFDEMKKRLIELAEEFDSPPFTIQRLCELLSKPKKNYTKCDKFMRGLEKNLMVVSSWNNTPRRLSESNESMMNGMGVGPSNGFNASDRLKPHWANLPPSPIATAPPKIPGAPDFTDMTGIMPIREALLEDKEDDPVEPESSAEGETANKEASEQPEEDSEKKSNVSATIISSSPPITINIKRKIDDSTDDQQNITEDGSPSSQVEESPTKKLKSDAPEVVAKVQEKKKEETNIVPSSETDRKTEESPEKESKLDVSVDKSDDSANSETDSAEMKNDSSGSADSKKSDSTDSQEGESPQSEAKMDTSNEGSSVDPPAAVKIELETQMEVD